jgi:hypothetical protein
MDVAFKETSPGALYEKEDDIDVTLAIEMCKGNEIPEPAERALERHCIELLEKKSTGAQDEDPIPTVHELVDDPAAR